MSAQFGHCRIDLLILLALWGLAEFYVFKRGIKEIRFFFLKMQLEWT